MVPLFSNKQKIILASGSPRRQAFLKELGISFCVIVANIEEKVKKGELAMGYTRRLAAEKAKEVSAKHPEQWVLSADTVVYQQKNILEKPRNQEEALEMLLQLRNSEHQVVTSFCLAHERSRVLEVRSVVTTVRFWDFSEELAVNYIATGEPFDKAGGYGIQGRGALLVKEVKGSYTNVVGLPLVECVELLLGHGVVYT